MEPIRSFDALCLQCLTPDKVTTATDGEKVIYVCGACGAVTKLLYGELPWKEAIHVRQG